MALTTRLLQLPPLVALVLIVGCFVLVGLACFWVVNRNTNVSMRRIHNDVAGFVFATVGVLYGVLLGFAVLVVWEQFELARANAALECAAASALERDLDAFPDRAGARAVRDRLIEHVRLIVTEEYPALSGGDVSARTEQSARRLWREVGSIRPENPWEQSLYEAVLDRLNEMSERRRYSRGGSGAIGTALSPVAACSSRLAQASGVTAAAPVNGWSSSTTT